MVPGYGRSGRTSFADALLSSAACIWNPLVRKAHKKKQHLRYARIDFVRRISADHVFYGLVTTRMELDPSIDLENPVVENEDMFSICNKTLDIPSRQGSIPLGLSSGQVRTLDPGHGEMR